MHLTPRLLAAAALVLGIGIVPASATNDSPDCHGQNQEECREDPQPDRGVDCEHSDDHRCATTTTTASTIVTDPTTTTTAGAATTTTAAPTTTTTSAAAAPPAAQITPAPVTEVEGLTETRPLETLPRTGIPVGGLVALGVFACVLGALAVYAGKTRHRSWPESRSG